MIEKIDAILALKPNAQFRLDGNVLTWTDPVLTEPTAKEITDKIAELQTAYDNNAYQRGRAEEYPSIADQLDDLYHNGIDGWKTTIKAIKDKHPKE
jgi:hypothetical protein